MIRSLALALAVGLALPGADVRANPVADFYKGKQVQVIVGYGPGGGYDVYARLLARHGLGLLRRTFRQIGRLLCARRFWPCRRIPSISTRRPS